MPRFQYSFSLTPPPEARREYAYPEFMLELAARWRQQPAQDDDALNFVSDEDGAAIIISADFFDIPDDKAQAIAEGVVASRIEAIEKAGERPVRILHRAVRPHAGGAGLEMSFAAEAEGDHVNLYLGYVTSRKVLNFSMVCRPGRHEAAALFNATIPGFRPRLP